MTRPASLTPTTAARKLRAGLKRRMPTIRATRPPGTAPGTVTVDPEAPPPIITVITYGPNEIEERRIDDLGQLDEILAGGHPVTWVNIDGLGDGATITGLADRFGLHPLAVEDVVNVHQRAKLEPYEGQLFVVARMARLVDGATGGPGQQVETEQVSMFVGATYMVTFQERPGDDFDLVRQRLRAGRKNIRGGGPGYLCYALLDAIVDAYFPLLESFSERLQLLEDQLVAGPDPMLLPQLHALKRELLSVRRAAWPHRELVGQLMRDESVYIDETVRVFLRDVYDHLIQLVDLIETYREIASSLMDLYMSSVGNRMNEIMKVLTIFAAIFIPLSFIAGVFGMNFDPEVSPWNMPELSWPYGYPAALAFMLIIAIGLLIYFRSKGWIGK